MSITLLVILIFIGVVLILLELLLLPGVGVSGIAGLGFLLYAIFSAYEKSTNYGHSVLVICVVVVIASIIHALRAKTWSNMSLKVSADGKLNDNNEGKIKVGDEGITISRLANIGKAEFYDEKFEVESIEGYIQPQTKIVITALKKGKIYVKSIS